MQTTRRGFFVALPALAASAGFTPCPSPSRSKVAAVREAVALYKAACRSVETIARREGSPPPEVAVAMDRAILARQRIGETVAALGVDAVAVGGEVYTCPPRRVLNLDTEAASC